MYYTLYFCFSNWDCTHCSGSELHIATNPMFIGIAGS